MNIQCKLVILILALTLDDQVHTGKIIGGHQAAPHSRPYMVLLEMKTQSGNTKHCGGFLLNEYFVMTAAHCQAKSYTVSLGVHNANQIHDKQKISVETAFPHEDYDSTNYKNDIMLLKMSSKAQFGKNVDLIPLADPSDHSLPQSCTVSGWGTMDPKINDLSPVLMEVDVKLIEQCDKAHSYCSQGHDGPDVGDSGGPLVCDGKAYGVVSYKTGEGEQKIYRYAKIPDYRKWIDSIMKN